MIFIFLFTVGCGGGENKEFRENTGYLNHLVA